MKILIDTREKPQAIRGIIAWFDRHGIAWEKRALKTGDYMLECKNEDLNNANYTLECKNEDTKKGPPLVTVIDRKQNLTELAHNLLSPDRGRFYREVRRAREEGIRLIILCENGGGIRTFEDVKRWKPKYGKVTGKALADAIFRLEIAYQVPVLYCDKRSTGRRIAEILMGMEEVSGNGN